MTVLFSAGNLPRIAAVVMPDLKPRHRNRLPEADRGRAQPSCAKAAWQGRRTLGRLVLAVASSLVLSGPVAAPARELPDPELEEVEKEIREHPNEAKGFLHRAELHRNRRQWAAARADLSAAARLEPALTDAVDLSLAGLLLEADDPVPAQQAVDRYLARKPDDASAHLLRARILSRQGLRRPAIDEYTRGIELARGSDGKGVQPDDYLQRARLQSCEGDEDGALRGIDEGLSRLGDTVTLELFAIDLELSRSRWDAALSRLAKIEAVARRKENWIARRADILAQAGRRADAVAAYAEAAAAIDTLPAAVRAAPATRELDARVRAARTGLETSKDVLRASKPPRTDWCAAVAAPLPR